MVLEAACTGHEEPVGQLQKCALQILESQFECVFLCSAEEHIVQYQVSYIVTVLFAMKTPGLVIFDCR